MDSLLLERAGGVATLTLNRPERKNAMGWPEWARLGEIVAEVTANDTDRVLVITGAGGDFCAGADLASAGSEGSPLPNMRLLAATAEALYRMPKPTIAKIDGVAVGAGRIAFTVMPSAPRALASPRTKPIAAILLAM